MWNFNGILLKEEDEILNATNRGLHFGDALKEELRVVNRHIFFLEEHYLKLMSSMRILRMEIPMEFTLEFFEEEILKTVDALDTGVAHLVKFTVFRNDSRELAPIINSISYLLGISALPNTFYTLDDTSYQIELFKDFLKSSTLLDTLDTNNQLLKVVGSVYANENDYDDCILLNERKMVVESLNGNLFLVKGNTVKTPPLSDGCINGILRKKVIEVVMKIDDIELLEETISPFELQKADELFIVNTATGILPVTNYRKKTYQNTFAKTLVGRLNTLARLAV